MFNVKIVELDGMYAIRRGFVFYWYKVVHNVKDYQDQWVKNSSRHFPQCLMETREEAEKVVLSMFGVENEAN